MFASARNVLCCSQTFHINSTLYLRVATVGVTVGITMMVVYTEVSGVFKNTSSNIFKCYGMSFGVSRMQESIQAEARRPKFALTSNNSTTFSAFHASQLPFWHLQKSNK